MWDGRAYNEKRVQGGKERMRRLMDHVKNEHVNLRQLITHGFSLDEIEEAYKLSSSQGDGGEKVAIQS